MKLFVVLALMLVSAASVIAVDPDIAVNGQVMEEDGTTPAGAGITVNIECNGAIQSDDTDTNSQYQVLFSANDCAVGDNVTASVNGGTEENGGKVITSVADDEIVLGTIILPPINLIIPEFSTVAASLAFAGASAGYLLLKKRK